MEHFSTSSFFRGRDNSTSLQQTLRTRRGEQRRAEESRGSESYVLSLLSKNGRRIECSFDTSCWCRDNGAVDGAVVFDEMVVRWGVDDEVVVGWGVDDEDVVGWRVDEVVVDVDGVSEVLLLLLFESLLLLALGSGVFSLSASFGAAPAVEASSTSVKSNLRAVSNST